MNEKTCKNCIHYKSEQKEDQEVQKGKCHRFPPCLLVFAGKIKHYFPIVTENDVCGEFQSK